MAETAVPGAHLNNPLVKECKLKDCSHQIFLDKPNLLLDGMINDLGKVLEPISVIQAKQEMDFFETLIKATI